MSGPDREGRSPWPGVDITIEPAIADTEIEIFQSLYEQAFAPLRTRAIARQVLHRNEFRDEMSDTRVDKIVARADGAPIGLTTLTRHLDTVPWISPEYFTTRFPQHAARNAIYYAGFTLVTPSARHGVAFHAMISTVVQILAADRAVVGWDICSYNNSQFSFADALRNAVGEEANIEVAVEDSQTYYAARFVTDDADQGG
ncbi:hypothetical protein [Nocardia vermiculata]|uniref:GNAT family N-acetyltransferase n=1 Tax=Nocardia vermiculata TaxID=257274 RepID=A0A846XXL9_9NOCA|nr:hypothetical protein [Nocardia vermiculata]NKY51853.1 hypothetical protein [Nocardia vermiculata]